MLESAFSRPALLISDARGGGSSISSLGGGTVSTATRDQEFLDTVMATLRGDGSVLVPVDAAGALACVCWSMLLLRL